VAQQYAPITGHPPLVAWARAAVREHHDPPASVEVCITSGNYDGLARVLDSLLDAGDTLLVDEYTFPYSMGILQPWRDVRGVRLVGVRASDTGLDATDLARKAPGAKALLTIPTGQNPTGADAHNLEEVYAVAARHDLWIVEDDPYYYTHFGMDSVPSSIAPRPSYLRLDVDGRVVRLDSFSKWMAPGLRCGWLSAAPTVVAKIAPLLAFASTLSQELLARTLEAWGEEGLRVHLVELRARYHAKCIAIDALLHRHLAGVCTWTRPQSGMFLWLRVVAGPWAEALATDASATELLITAMASHRVSVVPGCFFGDASVACLRVSFTSLSEEDAREGVSRLRALLTSAIPRAD
tara:strand:- start:7261 stop:8313 length:1053 start_codon:yes stop_codon:yes gene_type:complete